MLSTDAIVLLIKAQWERGLIVPSLPSTAPLREACQVAVVAGLCAGEPHEIISGKAICFRLTRAGWIRFGELTGTMIEFQ